MYCKGKQLNLLAVFYQEIDAVSITHFRSRKFQVEAYRWNDETPKQDLTNHANYSLNHTLRLEESEKHMGCSLNTHHDHYAVISELQEN